MNINLPILASTWLLVFSYLIINICPRVASELIEFLCCQILNRILRCLLHGHFRLDLGLFESLPDRRILNGRVGRNRGSLGRWLLDHLNHLTELRDHRGIYLPIRPLHLAHKLAEHLLHRSSRRLLEYLLMHLFDLGPLLLGRWSLPTL